VADVGFRINWEKTAPVMIEDECYQGFIFPGESAPRALLGLKHLVEVSVIQGRLPRLPLGRSVKFLPDFWELYKQKTGYFLKAFHPARKNILSYSEINFDFSRIKYYPQKLSPAVCRDYRITGKKNTWMFLHLMQPVLRYVFMNVLGEGFGLLAHGCAVKTDNAGFIFVGPSGSGKTTLAGILRQDKAITVLTDENIAIADKRGKIIIYGTPWPGGGRVACADKARLKVVCFIRHSRDNRLKKISPAQARRCLMQEAVWDAAKPRYVGNKLEFLQRLTQEIDCYELEFINDSSVADFLRRKLFLTRK